LVPLIKAGTLPSGIQLIDVRPTEQYVSGHLKGAISVPFDPIKHTMEMAKIPTDRAILLYCNHGAISADAYDVLPQEIARRVKVLEAELVCDAKGCTVR
jgi:rhodanese-related sulfurtransferase